MKIDGLTIIDFPPPTQEVVYVFFYALDGNLMPFYVGQTNFFLRRMDDYLGADFKAQADFKVGEAIKYLRDMRGLRVVVGYKTSANRLVEEKILIEQCSAAGPLLNQLRGYNYNTATIEDERVKVQRFCDQLIEDRRAPRKPDR